MLAGVKIKIKFLIISLLDQCLSSAVVIAQTSSLEDMWQLIQEQQKTIEALQLKLAATEETADAVEVVLL